MNNSVNALFNRVFVIILLPLVVFAGVGFAQNSEKAAKCYNKYYLKKDFSEAHECFNSVILENDDDPIANFGLALLFSNNSYKFDYFKAFHHIRKVKEQIDKLTEAQVGQLMKLLKDISDLKREITNQYTEIEKMLYESIVANPTITNSERFVNEFPDSKYLIDVMQIRNAEGFKKVKGENSVTAYNTYIERFPDADSLPAAIKFRNKVAYQDFTESPTLEKSYDYLNRYPNSEFTGKVIQCRDSLEYENAKKINTIASYGSFIEKFPRSQQIDHACDQYILLIFSDIQKRNSVKDYQEFINKYSSSDKVQTAVFMRNIEQVNEVKKLNTVNAYNNYISLFPNYALKNKEVIDSRNKKAYEDALESSKTIDALDDFVYTYPTATEVKEALEKRDTLILNNCRTLTSAYRVMEFLRPYPRLQQSPQGISILEQAAFKDADTDGSKEAYEDFLKNYPLSPFAKKATEKMEHLKK